MNPTLEAQVGDTVEITVINGDAVLHDLAINEFNVTTGELTDKDQQATVSFQVSTPGDFTYFCTVPGHKQAGMFGLLRVTGEANGDQAAANTGYGDAGSEAGSPNIPACL